MCNRTRHPQIVADPQPEYRGPIYPGTTTLDAEIAPLMYKLWEEGFETQASCQECLPDGKGYILFRDVNQAITFFRLTCNRSAERNEIAPSLTLETAVHLEDNLQLNPYKAVRGTIRFRHSDIKRLETLWLA